MKIPTDLALQDATAQVVAAGSAADRLWHLFRDIPGVGWVTAGKLCARKRPHLLPVYDERVRLLVGAPEDYWDALRLAFQANDGELATRLEAVRDAAGTSMSLIRVFDVIAWMEAADKLRGR